MTHCSASFTESLQTRAPAGFYASFTGEARCPAEPVRRIRMRSRESASCPNGGPMSNAELPLRTATDRQEFSEPDGWLTRTHVVSRTVYWGIHAAALLAFYVGA